MKKVNIIILFMLGLMVIPMSCTKDFEEINTDPNNPVTAPSINILANVIRFHTGEFYNAWGDMNEPSSYANHLGKIQYIDEAAYRFREGVVNGLWSSTYVNINDLDIIIRNESAEGGNPNYLAMAMTIRAWRPAWIACSFPEDGQSRKRPSSRSALSSPIFPMSCRSRGSR